MCKINFRLIKNKKNIFFALLSDKNNKNYENQLWTNKK